MHELDELDEDEVDSDDNDDGLFFSKLEAAELDRDDDADEFWPLDLHVTSPPLRMCWLTCGYLILILSTTSSKFLASIASTCADDNMPLK